MDGIFDWYWLGVGLGLGVTAGLGLVWALRGGAGRPVGSLALAAAVAGGVAIGVLVVVWAFAALAGGAAVALASFRRLSLQALPAAVLLAAALAFVPALGYLEGLATPVLGRRLGRRAASRYAGLRILARD